MNVTGTGIAVALAVIIAVGAIVFAPHMFGPPTSAADTSQMTELDLTSNQQPSMPTIEPGQPLPTELTVTDTVVGTGAEAAAGKTVSLLYTGWLPDGIVFDASVNHGNDPITFPLGTGYVIPGWDQGIVGMKVGGKRQLIIPADMAYGAAGRPGIPPNSTLIFDVELVGVQ